jgi:ABC-type ATPase involved in cell division
MTLLRFEHVSRCYRDGHRAVPALAEVSFELAEGDLVGLWGARRSGKSTLLRVAVGLEAPDDGEVHFAGSCLARISQDERVRLMRSRGARLVDMDWHPERNQPIIEHVALGLLSSGMSLREARSTASRTLARVGLSNHAYSRAEQLSRAERVRVGLAQALVHAPRLLLIDEPAVLSSPDESTELYELLRTLNRDLRLAMVIASEEVAPLREATRTLRIDSGTVRVMDPAGTVLAFPGRRAATTST